MSDDLETIVRALAETEPTFMEGERSTRGTCLLCYSVDEPWHDPDCPWRMAVEWVARADTSEAL